MTRAASRRGGGSGDRTPPPIASPPLSSSRAEAEGRSRGTSPVAAWLGVLLLLLAGCQSPTDTAPPWTPPDNPPNILFVAVDDLNDWTGMLGGHPQAHTPHLDRLAAQGLLFTNAHTAAPACNPSRVALMTGLRPSSTGIYFNNQPMRVPLPDVVTLPQYFMAHGYLALGSGKIYHDTFPDSLSWDAFTPALTRQRFDDPEPSEKTPERKINGIPGRGVHFDWGPLAETPDSSMGDHRSVAWAIEQLGRDFDQPFFLACGIYRPHLPWFVPETYFDRFPLDEIVLPDAPENDLDDIPPGGREMIRFGDHEAILEADQWERAVQAYLASIAFADAQVGRLMEALEASPHAGHTVVVLWSDHGWHLGEKHHWRKFSLWEESTRVPLVVIAPSGTPGLPEGTTAGQTSHRPVNLLDLYPTLVELAGLPPKEDLEGTSLAPLLRDPAAEWTRPSVTTYGRNNHAVRSEHWRYIRYADGTEELYDHDADPGEHINLTADPTLAGVIAEHRRWLPEVNVENAPRAE